MEEQEQMTRDTSNIAAPLLNLDAKAYVQPLGSDNAWNELGDGWTELVGHSLRVTYYPEAGASADADASPTENSYSNNNHSSKSPQIILEDTIEEDTPFVASDCCVVWNSNEQQLSMCIMFNTDLGFQCTWAAIQALQQQPPAPLEHDFLHSAKTADECKTVLERMSCGGSIERHAIARCIVDQDHCVPKKKKKASSTTSSKDNLPLILSGECAASNATLLFGLGSADLVEYVCRDDVFPHLVSALRTTKAKEDGEEQKEEGEEAEVAPVEIGDNIPTTWWSTPEGLPHSDELSTTVANTLKIHFLKHQVLPIGTPEEVISLLDGVDHRLQNEIVCGLLSNTELLQESITNMATSDDASVVVSQLRFLSNLSSLCMTALAKELLPHAMGRIGGEDGELLRAVTEVCRRWCCKDGAPKQTSTQKQQQGEVEAALMSFLDTLIVKLNERGEEGILNDIFRKPATVVGMQTKTRKSSVVHKPTQHHPHPPHNAHHATRQHHEDDDDEDQKGRKGSVDGGTSKNYDFSPFFSLLMAQLSDTSSSSSSAPHSSFFSSNSILIYHLLGLHDDEGSSVDRMVEPELVEQKNEFHKLFVTNVLPKYLRDCQKTIQQQEDEEQEHEQKEEGEGDNNEEEQNDKLDKTAVPDAAMEGEGGPKKRKQKKEKDTRSKRLVVANQSMIRLLEFCLGLFNDSNRSFLIENVIFARLGVLSHLQETSQNALEGCAVKKDEMCAHIRFLKSLLQASLGNKSAAAESSKSPSMDDPCGVAAALGVDSWFMNPHPPAHSGSAKQHNDGNDGGATKHPHDTSSSSASSASRLLALVLKQLILYGASVMQNYLILYNRPPPQRRTSLFHCTLRSLLCLVRAEPKLVDYGQFLMHRHRTLLPADHVLLWDAQQVAALLKKYEEHDDVSAADPSSLHGLSGVRSATSAARSITPLAAVNVGGILDISAGSSGSGGGSGKKKLPVVDEVATPADAHQLEDIAAFPQKLREMIGGLSPTPKDPLPPSEQHPSDQVSLQQHQHHHPTGGAAASASAAAAEAYHQHQTHQKTHGSGGGGSGSVELFPQQPSSANPSGKSARKPLAPSLPSKKSGGGGSSGRPRSKEGKRGGAGGNSSGGDVGKAISIKGMSS